MPAWPPPRPQIATAAASLAWMFAEWLINKKPSVLGMISGAVAGLVAITPASGFVDPVGALIIGLAAGAVCYVSSVWLKKLLGYDDALDAFGVHGVAARSAPAHRCLRLQRDQLAGARLADRRQFRADVYSARRRRRRVRLLRRRHLHHPQTDRHDHRPACLPEVEVEGLDINLHGETVHG